MNTHPRTNRISKTRVEGRQVVNRHRFAMIVSALAVVFFSLSRATNLDYGERLADRIAALESHEADEAIFSAVFVLFAVIADSVVAKRRLRQEQHDARIRQFRATMNTMHNLVNNTLNELTLLQLEAVQDQRISDSTLSLFQEIIASTAEELRLIGDLEEIAFVEKAPGIEMLATSQPEYVP